MSAQELPREAGSAEEGRVDRSCTLLFKWQQTIILRRYKGSPSLARGLPPLPKRKLRNESPVPALILRRSWREATMKSFVRRYLPLTPRFWGSFWGGAEEPVL